MLRHLAGTACLLASMALPSAGAVAVVGGVALGVHMLAEEEAQDKTGRISRE